MNRATFLAFVAVLIFTFTGCWTAPNSNVQPAGGSRLIQSGIPAESVREWATVRNYDAGNRILDLDFPDGSGIICHVSPQFKMPRPIQAGDKIKVSLSEKLSLYVLKDGRLPGDDKKNDALNIVGRVQSFDPSYRLLTVHYLSGQTETLKIGLGAGLAGIRPGDSVVVESAEATDIRFHKS